MSCERFLRGYLAVAWLHLLVLGFCGLYENHDCVGVVALLGELLC